MSIIGAMEAYRRGECTEEELRDAYLDRAQEYKEESEEEHDEE